MVHECEEGDLGVWNIGEFRVDFSWSERNFEEKFDA